MSKYNNSNLSIIILNLHIDLFINYIFLTKGSAKFKNIFIFATKTKIS